MIKLFKYFRWYYWLIALVIISLIVGQVLADLELIEYLKIITHKIGSFAENELLRLATKMIILAISSVICTILSSFLAAKVAAGFAHDIRQKIYKKVQEYSPEEIEKFSTASLITRSTNDITQIQTVVVMMLRMAVQAPVTAVLSIIKVSNQTYQLTNILIVSIAFLITFVTILFFLGIPKFKLLQKLTDRLNLVTRENLTGLRVVRAYGAQEIEEKKFQEVNDKITKTQKFLNRVMSLMNPGMRITMDFTSLAIIWIGAMLIAHNIGVEPEEIIGFQQYSMKIVIAFMNLSVISIMIPRGSVSAHRIMEVLKIDIKIKDPQKELFPDENKLSTIEFRDVSFSYPNASEPVLENINLKITAGETVAFIGSTGSGKSTLINLIPRFFDVTSGSILIDGIDIRDYNQKTLHEKIGYIPQKGILFSGTIASNLCYGRTNATEEEMYEALEIAQMKDFVLEKEEKLNALVAQGGTNYSGGQKQRITIARALIKKAEINIFDDSFSALDFKTDQKIRMALKDKLHNSIVLIVAQRIGTILEADQIIVLDQGKIVGRGNHHELLESCEIYQEIAYSQLSKEELENA